MAFDNLSINSPTFTLIAVAISLLLAIILSGVIWKPLRRRFWPEWERAAHERELSQIPIRLAELNRRTEPAIDLAAKPVLSDLWISPSTTQNEPVFDWAEIKPVSTSLLSPPRPASTSPKHSTYSPSLSRYIPSLIPSQSPALARQPDGLAKLESGPRLENPDVVQVALIIAMPTSTSKIRAGEYNIGTYQSHCWWSKDQD